MTDRNTAGPLGAPIDVTESATSPDLLADSGLTESRHPIELTVTGMTCASCVARVEKALTRIDGVDATVNLATERARALVPDSVTAADLIAAVAASGRGVVER